MLDSRKDYYPRISPAEATQIFFSFENAPVINRSIKAIPFNEENHKKFRKKWKRFSRKLLTEFTKDFSKKLSKASLTVIKLRNYYLKQNLHKWRYRYKWINIAHRIYKNYFINQIREKYLEFKKENDQSPYRKRWKIWTKLLTTSETRNKLYNERNILIAKKRKKLTLKWNDISKKLRPKNFQNVQKSFEEKRHNKYIYRQFFLRWLLKYRSQEDSIQHIFNVDYPDMNLITHMNISFDIDPYLITFNSPQIARDVSLLKDVIDYNEMLKTKEIENISDIFNPDDLNNSTLVRDAILNSFEPITSCKQVEIPKESVPRSIFDDFDDMQSYLLSNDKSNNNLNDNSNNNLNDNSNNNLNDNSNNKSNDNSNNKSNNKSIDNSNNNYCIAKSIDLTARMLDNYQIPENPEVEHYFIVDENDLLLAPDFTFILQQPEKAMQQMDRAGPCLKLLFNLSFDNFEEEEEEIAFEEEEEIPFEEEEEEIEFDFGCLDPLYLDVPTDVISSTISRSVKCLDESSLIFNDNSMNDRLIESSLRSQKLLEKSRIVPPLFKEPAVILSPLYSSHYGRRENVLNPTERAVDEVAKNIFALLPKTRYPPSFLTTFSPLIDNIVRYDHLCRSSQANLDGQIDFVIRPKVVQTSHFLENVRSSISPIFSFRKKDVDAKEPDFSFAGSNLFPKVRFVPYLFTIVSKTVNNLNSFSRTRINMSKTIEKNVPEDQNEAKKKRVVKRKVATKTIKKKNVKSIKVIHDDDDDLEVLKSNPHNSKKGSRTNSILSPYYFNGTDGNEDEDADDIFDFTDKSNQLSESSEQADVPSKKGKKVVKRKKIKKRAVSAKNSKKKENENEPIYVRKYIIQAESIVDDENEVNVANFNSTPLNKNVITTKKIKKKKRSISVNSSPRKMNSK